MTGVIDTSALIRLFVPDGPIPDGLEEFMHAVERGMNRAIAPELILVEAANVLNKKRKLGELSEDESMDLLTDVLAMPIRYLSHRPLIPVAFDLAKEHNLTVYDALYLALAKRHSAFVFSADQNIKEIAEVLGLR
ncbi:MAG: type II toxin-antitoxin system VapC family toxin [Deltaproteobacteria bacterium]|nr:type II toxin-antitoxin system VapC family toxin [Deltaproteobacteria bacterium]MBW2071941.1 type II toxin-antitoxin system VapC family toxin [Deltaproteobacteria bacterium]